MEKALEILNTLLEFDASNSQHNITKIQVLGILGRADESLTAAAAFVELKNDDPELLMEAAEWWIRTHKLDHFEKALKIQALIENGQ